MTPPSSFSWSRPLVAVGGVALVALAAGCFGTEIPPQKPEQSPLAGLPPAKPTADATKVEDQPNARKASAPDEKPTADAIARATRTASQCPQIHTEGPFGDYTLTLVLVETGKVGEARLPAEIAEKPIGKCVKKAYEAEIIPPWQGSPVNRTVQLSLKKPDTAPAASAKPAK